MTATALPSAVLDALSCLPNGDAVPAHRAHLLAADAGFASTMARVETTVDPAPVALAELWLWLIHLCVDMGSRPKTTGKSYGRVVGRFLGWCRRNGYDHREIGVTEFDRWARWLAIECRNKENFRRQQIHALRNFYDWRRSRGLAETNIAIDFKYPRIKPRPAKKYTDAQLREMFRAVAALPEPFLQRDRAILLLFLSTGLRREELCNLRWPQLEVGQRIAVVRIDGKGAKQREVPFEGPAVTALRDWLLLRDAMNIAHDAVFVTLHHAHHRAGVSSIGDPLSLDRIERIIKQHARAAKLREWGIHRFRVTFATQLYDDGADIETIRALMGHESIETTRRYLAVSERARRTRLSADRQHAVLGTRPTGKPLWVKLAMGELTDAG